MQRPSKKNETTTYSIFPMVFWRHCECCSSEFRWARGWRYLGGPFVGGAGVWRYVCGECAPTRELASEMAKQLPCGMRPIKPPPPPSPPRVR